MTVAEALRVSIPGHGSFTVTADAAAMIEVFGGRLHCYQGSGGCRKQGLYFSRAEPKKPLRCRVELPDTGETGARAAENRGGRDRLGETEIILSVSHELAPKLGGAVLDFGNHNKMQRFVWLAMPAVKGPACTCRRSMGPPAGKRSPCLDDRGIGLSDV
ncbi:peptidase [Arthrobacter sp. PAMC25564]|uniref:peptidase n=1 Tax=Arthrobacter sp. PAMC25564 TaxID=2565366 RepID=UPI0010A264A7|nr:peptidase [Arthrobacter sp. PAMC25564]QCB96806.1 peptidase [Arthrobacter sp. PAMC25564]